MVRKQIFSMQAKMRRLAMPVAAGSLAVIIGLFVTAHALSTISTEAESGLLSGSVSAFSDSSASAGGAIQYGQATTTTLPNPGTWTDITGNLVGVPSDCGSISSVFSMPGTSKVIAGVARNGLWATANDGTWAKMPGSASIADRPMSLVFDPTNSNIFWEAGMYDAPGVNKTLDGGNTFQSLGGTVAFDLFSLSVDFSDPTRQRILAGARRRPQIVWKTTDNGAHWTNIGLNLPADTDISTNPLFINATTYLINTNNTGIYRTTDGGSTWQQVTNRSARTIPLVASNGTIYWSSDDGLIKSTDSGVTWTRVGSGLVNNVTPIQLPDGRIVAMGGGSLVVSADGGSTWTAFGAPLPPQNGASGITNITYSAVNGAFYGSQFTCGPVGDPVHAGAIWRLK